MGKVMTKISLTPIIDVVFILLIFFMLATNFQKFNATSGQAWSIILQLSNSRKYSWKITIKKTSYQKY